MPLLAGQLRSTGATVIEVQADLATYEGVEALVAAIARTGRPVDAIALNAGVGNGGLFADIALKDDAVDTDERRVHGACGKADSPSDGPPRKGRLLFTSSVAGTMPGPFYATYPASKSFVESFAEALRYEIRDSGVTVTALMPGPTDTNFFDRAKMQNTPAGQGKKDDPAEVAADGFKALMAGKDPIVAGSVNQGAGRRHRCATGCRQGIDARETDRTTGVSTHPRAYRGCTKHYCWVVV